MSEQQDKIKKAVKAYRNLSPEERIQFWQEVDDIPQDEITRLRVRNAQIEATLSYSTSGSLGVVEENAKLRLNIDELRRTLSELIAIINRHRSVIPIDIIEMPDGNEGRPHHSDWMNLYEKLKDNAQPDGTWSSCVVGVSLFIRNSSGAINVGPNIWGIYPGTIEEFEQVIPRQLMTMLCRIPTAIDIRRTPLRGLDATLLFNIMYDLAISKHTKPLEEFMEHRRLIFAEIWPIIEDYEKQNPPTSTYISRETAQKEFTRFTDDTFKAQAERIERESQFPEKWEKPHHEAKKRVSQKVGKVKSKK